MDTSKDIVGEMADITEASTQSMKAIDNLGDAILGVNTNLHDTTPAMEKARDAMDNLGKGQKQLTKEELKAIEDKKKAEEKARKANAAADKILDDMFNEEVARVNKINKDRAELKEKLAQNARKRERKRAEERLREMTQLTNAIAGAADSMGNAFVSAYDSAEEGQNKLAAGGRAMAAELIDQALSSMQKFITAEAAKAAAAAATSAAAFGPLAAAGAAALMFSLVRGGVQGSDSVPTMLMPGEFVLTKKQTDSLRAGGGGSTMGSGGGSVNVSINTTVPPNRAEMKRYIRQNLVPAMRELKSQGMSF